VGLSDAAFISKGGQTDYLVGLKDLWMGISRTELWWAFATEEIQQRYRRSRLGIAWIVISYMLFVAAISVFFGGFSEKRGSDFVAYVSVNYAMFSFLTANLQDGCAVFRSSKTWISSVPFPHSVHVLKSVARSVFVFAICFLVAIIVLLATGHLRTPISFLAVPAFIVLIFNGILVQTTLGYITARFRDLEHLIQSLTRVLFFVTPILWVRNEQPEGTLRRSIAEFNPFTHALEIFTSPMLGQMPDMLSWQIMGVITLANLLLMLAVSNFAYRRLSYWM
jgi:ABC-type polysaccharide/polyol phosphate export permease